MHEPRLVIRIGEASVALDELLGAAQRAAFLTAANPRSDPRSEEENRRRLFKLRQALDERTLRYLEGEGRESNGSWKESSFLIFGIAREEAIRLARRFEQSGFVWCEAGKAPELVLVEKWRLVLDTQVWLDWLAFDDPSVVELKAAVAADRAEIYLDAACEAELGRVLGYPIGKRLPEKDVQAARLAEARRLARRPAREASGSERASLPRCSDRDDQKFLELALAARADALLTKDRALLELARWVPFRICRRFCD